METESFSRTNKSQGAEAKGLSLENDSTEHIESVFAKGISQLTEHNQK